MIKQKSLQHYLAVFINGRIEKQEQTKKGLYE